MPPLDPQLQRAIADRLAFYRELGIYDFYRRDVPQEFASAEEILPLTVPASPASLNCAADFVSLEALAAGNANTLVEGAKDRSAALRAIREDLGDCVRCRLSQGRRHIVFGTGDPGAQLMFVGEGPGADEDEQGLPFVGRAGQLLNNMIQAMGLERKQVYIANVVKCRPPGNRVPERDECDTCSPFLLRQIEVISPKVIVALGATAAKTLLGAVESMAKLRGQWHDFHGTRLAVTYHPAYLLRDPRQKKEAWKDLQMVMQHLGLKPPAKTSEV